MAARHTSRKNSGKRGSSKTGFDLQALLNYVYWVLAIVSVVSAAGVIGFYAGYNQAKAEDAKTIAEHRKKSEKLQKKITQLSSETAKHEYPAELAKQIDKPLIKKVPRPADKRGKLAIIIDDVAFGTDVREIKALDIPVTMSFLPPTSRHPDSARLAEKEPYYMVHLPMEAMNFDSPERSTLMTTDTKERVLERIEEVKRLFPRVQYVNNHTGSRYTSDEEAMNRLIFALRKEEIGFVDSRTTAASKVEKVMKRYKMPYLVRDIFLDHEDDAEAIKLQIKKAIKIANKDGKCIAICHPHKTTLKAIRDSRGLFAGVDLVRIDEFAK